MAQVKVVGQVGHRSGVERRGRDGLPVDDRREQTVHHLVSVSADGRREVRVDRTREAVVQVLRRRERARAEVTCLLHGARGEDTRELVKVRVFGLDAGVERGAKRERRRRVEREAMVRERALQRVECAGERRRVPPQHGAERKRARDLGRHRNVGEQHEFLHHRVGLLELVHANLGDLGRFVNLKTDLWGSERERARGVARGLKLLRQTVEYTERSGELVVESRVVEPGLRLRVRERRLRADDALDELGRNDLGIGV
mmetsp:Transcript_32225/g.70590  ORF Transcript_32225/g.70590 Transcript_32225/m.70590 type:complete len:257 (-) Transcript_32225:2732-3502(-)